jgi:hypothetical protein
MEMFLIAILADVIAFQATLELFAKLLIVVEEIRLYVLLLELKTVVLV